ncbi:MAG: DoxX family protein [Rhodobacteraceae bacterium]|nr:DoxX family protein [Alphaproteobacteria bacterium]MBT8475337.1 DoxX family protein [Alphaproteobacteria bacterium]NNF71960.1 DoxX family protein [Paracoccaceae bacterium]NNK65608.1 DoxX family protein [Paracoccaceae bacterium]
MTLLVNLHAAIFSRLEAIAPFLIPTLARLIFAGTLFVYYWNSALTKFGDGITGLFLPSAGGYIQIFPKAFEAAGYDVSQLGTFHWLVVLAGTYAEILLPILIVIGLFTRLAALGMIGFVIVQSVVDIIGHGLGAADIGSWFDGMPSALIVDQRAFWVFLLLVLVLRGAGPLSVDRLLSRRVEAD